VDLTKVASNGLAGMHVACKHGHTAIVHAMLLADETVKDVISPDGRTPCVFAFALPSPLALTTARCA
jgi:hypothetical protein